MQKTDVSLIEHGATVIDLDGDKLGTVTEILLDADTESPQWAVVDGVSGQGGSAFVPLLNANVADGSLRVPFAAVQVASAPIAADHAPTVAEESKLFDYYGVEGFGGQGGAGAFGEGGPSGDQGIRLRPYEDGNTWSKHEGNTWSQDGNSWS